MGMLDLLCPGIDIEQVMGDLKAFVATANKMGSDIDQINRRLSIIEKHLGISRDTTETTDEQ